MASKLLLDLLSGQVQLDSFYKWIVGDEIKDISSSQDRTEFVLHLLNYIQEETNKFVLASSSSAIQTKVKDDGGLLDGPSATTVSNKKPPDVGLEAQANESQQRTPFQVINRITPTTTKQPFARHLNCGNETRRDILNCSTNQKSKNITTSTPVQTRRNTSGHDQCTVSPLQTSVSPMLDHSSPHTPRSSKSSGTKFNSSSGSHRFSPQSNSSVFSPSSPHYSDTFPDLGSKNRRIPQSPCLADFITTKPTSQKSRKRIKPTTLMAVEDKDDSNDSKNENNSFGSVSRPFVPLNSPLLPQPEVKDKSNFDEERNLLKQKRTQCLNISQNTPIAILPRPMSSEKSFEKEKEQSKQYQILNISAEPTAISLPIIPMIIVDPDPSLITSVERVVRLAAVYSACLDNNLVPNITSELYMIFTLLSASYRVKASVSGITSRDGSSVESAEEFPTSKHCSVPLQTLSLEDGPSVGSFAVEDTPVKVTGRNGAGSVLGSVHNCVMFAATVVEKQFHILKCLDKSVIRLLLDNTRLVLFVPHFIPQLMYIAQDKETKEVSSLVKKPFVQENGPVLYHNETDNKDNFSSPSNFNQFKKQRDGFYELLSEWQARNADSVWAAKRFPHKVQDLLDHSSDPLNLMHLARLFCAQLTSSKREESGSELEMPGVPRDKLSRLEARFSKPQEPGAPRPPPQFPGHQQFYQHFLQLASGSPFLSHVQDCLLHRLDLLDTTVFFKDGLGMEESKAQVQSCVSECCLLAKFLGLIIFLPYRTNILFQPETLQTQLVLRQLTIPPVNLAAYLQRALGANRLLITIPWVVAFLGMMDPVTPLLPSYHLPLQLLASVYRAMPLPNLSPLSSLLLRCSLGWLFDVSYFPEALFFSLITGKPPLGIRSREPADVDVNDVVDQSLLCETCPFLVQLRVVLFTGPSLKRGAVRHITPVTALLPPSTQAAIAHTLELQLEESFLNGQAASFRVTVDFLVDRLSSSCIKHICSNVISSCKDQATATICNQREEIKKMSKQQSQVFVSELCQETEAQIETALADHCGAQLESVLSVLLRADASDATVFSTTHNICGRRCRERIVNWLNSHINLTDMFSKLVLSVEAKPSGDLMFKAPLDSKSVVHKDSATSPPDLLILLQDRLCQYIENRELVVTEQEVLALLHAALETVQFRSDLIPAAEHLIFTATVDLSIVLLAYHPAVVSGLVLEQLCTLWLRCGQAAGPLERVMSARNVLLLCQAGGQQARQSWSYLASLLVCLLKSGLLTPAQLEAQCVALFRLDWPPMVLSLMGTCLTSTLEKIKQDLKWKEDPKFILMLEWVKEMTDDLARDDVIEES